MRKDEGRDLLLLPALLIGAGGWGFAADEALRRVGQVELPPQLYMLAVGFLPACLLTAACFRQKHTYDAKIYERRPVRLAAAWLCFLAPLLVIFAALLGLPSSAFWFILREYSDRVPDSAPRVFNAGFVLACGLFSALVSVSALSRGLFLWFTHRQVSGLATSTARAAAPGLVELKGVARTLDGVDGLVFGRYPDHAVPARPFLLEDATGRIRVVPPDVDPWDDPRFALKSHPRYGMPALESGDSVLVVGELREEGGERVVKPWAPSSPFYFTRLLSRRDIFLVSNAQESVGLRKLFKSRLGWLALGAALTAGSLGVVAVSSLALLRALG